MTTYTGNCSDCIETGAVGVLETLFQRLHRWLKVQTLKVQVRKERQQLLNMSDVMLRDLGITREQAEQEAQRLELPEFRVNALGRKVC